MKNLILLALASLSFYPIQAQEDISGIINAYAAVQSIDYCSNTLQVASTDGFAEGEALILIQMQGATIDVSNSAAYGNIVDLRQAGRYERAVIASINGMEITLENALLNAYDSDGAVQIVSMPNYSSGVRVTNLLTAKTWDGATGGILAFEATSVDLQSSISVNGTGFRGGSAALDYTGDCSFLSNYNNFAYDEGSIRGGRKGEGISAIPSSRSRGRGSQANGGGGGNDHNSGGGGGANSTVGGQGGENNNPSFFGCSGSNPGQGGKALSTSFERIFMGGGGGAGHGNNDVATDGGNGGGIIMIRAGEILSNGFVIDANGESAVISAGDGGGGGGGGGTIILSLENDNGNGLLLEATGGLGGNTNNNNSDQCFGPGGGGGGGRILRAGASMATTNLAGGQPGLSTNSSACGEGTNNAAPGNQGIIQTFEGLPEGDEAFAPYQLLGQTGDTSSCAGLPLSLPVSVQGSGLSLQWQVDEGNGFADLQSGLEYSATDLPELLINTVTNVMNGNQYRLLISGNCVDTVFTTPLTLTVVPGPLAAFAYTTTSLMAAFDNTSSNADTYNWNFGDGNGSTAFEPTHTFSAPGTYEVSLSAISNACNDTATFTTQVQVILEVAPEADFDPMPTAGCTPLSVLFSNTSTGENNTYQWFFPGGDPASSTDGAPIITYNTPGDFDVTLIATNNTGSDTLTVTGAVQAETVPTSDFGLLKENLTIILSNLSINAESYFWDFGDGNTSTDPNPTHTYNSAGDYEVSLLVTNVCGSDIFVLPVSVAQRPLPLYSTENSTSGCPPYTVYFINESTGDFDSLRWEFIGGTPASSNISNPEVIYDAPGQYPVQLTLFWANGEELLNEPQAITVLERPEPAFSYQLDGLTATFTNLSANATDFTWIFGDGTTSNEENPVHTYSGPGDYNVTLNASNQGECTRAVGQAVFIQPNGIGEHALPEGVRVFPNPTFGELRLQSDQPSWYPVRWRLFNPQGQMVDSGTANQDRLWRLGQWPAGAYLLQFFNAEGAWTVRVMKY